MKVFVSLFSSAFLLFHAGLVVAGSATWNLNPTSNDWETAANWTPATVPDDPSDIATFDVSNVTDILADTSIDVGAINFSPGASAFTISSDYPGLSFYGTGITNNSGVVQTIGIDSDSAPEINFYNSATAGENTILFENGHTFDDDTVIAFNDTSSAGGATINNYGNSGPGGFGGTHFYDSSTAANATIYNRSGDSGGNGGFTFFHGSSKAGSATIVCEAVEDFPAELLFYDTSSAENATIIVNGAPPGFAAAEASFFTGTPTADNATLIIKGGINGGPGGTLSFNNGSLGGTARVEVFGNGTLDMSGQGAFADFSIGSLEGNGLVLLGSNTPFLTIGTNNLTTVFSGVIQGNGVLTKSGTGTLTLSGTNTYTGGTTVVGGFLKISNRTGSATGTGRVTIYSGGTLGGSGIVGGSMLVSSGGSLAPGTGTATLTVKKKLTFGGASYYTWRVKPTSGKADKVVAGTVTIGSGAFFSGVSVGSATLPPGTVFTAIDNTSSAPISGTFAHLPDGGTIRVGNNTFQANYEGGDGNDLTLTVVP